MLRTGDYNFNRKGAFASVPSYRHYFRNTRILRNRRNSSQNENGWYSSFQPSCKFFLFSFCTVLIITFMIYVRSHWIKPHHWKWTISDTSSSSSNANNIKKYNLMQQKLENEFLSKYPLIEPHRAHEGFTCDPWHCKSTFNINTNEWIEPRKEYKLLLPDNEVYYQWMERHKEQNEKLIDSKQKCEWIFIGNSITYSWNYHQNIFDKYFNTNNNAIIYAQSGDKIHEIGWRLNNKQENGFKNIQKCLNNNNNDNNENGQKSIILLIGTNDIGSGTKYNIVLNDFMVLLDQLNVFMDNNNNNNVNLYLLGIFPRGETYISINDRMEMKDQIKKTENFNVDNAYFYSINFINDYLKYFVDNHGKDNIKYINCNEHFMNNKNIVEFKDNDGELHQYQTGIMTLDTMDDMLHLNEKGYDQLAQCILHNIYGLVTT